MDDTAKQYIQQVFNDRSLTDETKKAIASHIERYAALVEANVSSDTPVDYDGDVS